MVGKDYSEQAYHIQLQFDELTSSIKQDWRDDQATKFVYEHVDPMRKAFSDIQIPIEYVVDILDTKLNEIRSIANEH